MDKKISRVVVSLVCAFAFALLSPSLVEACWCPGGCEGTYCWCDCNFCSDVYVVTNPCGNALSYNASQQELAAFKEQIDTWSGNENLSMVVEAATELYNSVLFKDSQSFAAANDKFRQAIISLSDETRKSLIHSGERQDRRK